MLINIQRTQNIKKTFTFNEANSLDSWLHIIVYVYNILIYAILGIISVQSEKVQFNRAGYYCGYMLEPSDFDYKLVPKSNVIRFRAISYISAYTYFIKAS